MAASFLASGSVGSSAAVSTLTTGSFDGSGSDRAIVAAMGSATSTGGAIPTAVTWDVLVPEALTSKVTLLANTYDRCSLWGLANSTSATDTVTVVWAGNQDEAAVGGHSITGVDTAAAFGNTQSGSGTGAAEPSETLTSVASDDLCIDALWLYPTQTATVGANQTQRVNVDNTGAYIFKLTTSTQPGTAGGAMTWTIAGTPRWTHVALVIKAPAGGRTTKNTRAWTHGTQVGMGHRIPI